MGSTFRKEKRSLKIVGVGGKVWERVELGIINNYKEP